MTSTRPLGATPDGVLQRAKPSRRGRILTPLLVAFVASATILYFSKSILDPLYYNIDPFIHYRWTYQYVHDLAAGFLPPRWAPLENGGIGAPVFLYYPPAFYLVALPLAVGLADLSLAIRLTVAAVGLGLVAAVAWSQRRRLGSAGAWCLGLLVLWAPPSFLVQGFLGAYPWYLSLIPTYLFIDASQRQAASGRMFSPAVPGWLALLYLCHPLSAFMALIAVPFLWLRRLAASRLDRGTVLAALGWGAGVALGLALVGVTLVPSLALLSLVNPHGWREDGGFGWEQSFVMAVVPFSGGSWRAPFFWKVAATTYVLAGAAALCLFRTRGRGGQRWEAAADWLWVALPCLVLASQVSYPVWAVVHPLQILQRPFRFLPIGALAALTAAAYVLLGLRPAIGRPSQVILLATLCAMVATTARMQFHPSMPPTLTVTPASLAAVFGTPEYWPATRGPRWRDYVEAGGFPAECRRLDLRCAASAGGGAFTWEIEAPAPVAVRLPLFAFPAWQVTDDGEAAGSVDEGTGLVLVELPAGTSIIQARWRALPAERIGSALTAAAALALCGWGVLRRRGRRLKVPPASLPPPRARGRRPP